MSLFWNLWKPFAQKWLLTVYGGSVLCFAYIWWKFTNIENMIGNHGPWHTFFDMGLSWMTILVFPLLIIGILYKSMLFWKVQKDSKTISAGFWGIVSVILSWSTCCWVTLASYFWLIPLMQFFPWSGIELKSFGVIALLSGTLYYYSSLDTCSLGKSTHTDTRIKKAGKSLTYHKNR